MINRAITSSRSSEEKCKAEVEKNNKINLFLGKLRQKKS